MELKWKILIGLSFLILIGLSVFLPTFLSLFPGREGAKVDTITINKDEDFIKGDFPGSGTAQDPFRIENIELGTYEDVLRESYKLIAIRNITAHVLIQNCIFIGCEYGVYIDSVKYGLITIRNNTFIGTEFRVWDVIFSGSISVKTTESENIFITNNSFMGEVKPAIEIDKSSSITISKNKIMLNEFGIAIGSYYSSNIIIDSNVVEPVSSSLPYYEGIYFIDLLNCVIKNNVLREVNIYFRDCNSLKFQNNSFESEIQEFAQLTFSKSVNIEITLNDFTGSEHQGIKASSTSNLIISKNTFDVGKSGFRLYDVQDTIIIYNSFHNNSGFAIWIDYDSSNATIYHNNFFNNHPSGYSQCYNENPGNIWYNIVLSEGNYWSNLGSNSTYSIAGPAGSEDLYPLTIPTGN